MTNDSEFGPFWNNKRQEASKKLWLPTKSLELNDTNKQCFNGSLIDLETFSWFSVHKYIPKDLERLNSFCDTCTPGTLNKWIQDGMQNSKIVERKKEKKKKNKEVDDTVMGCRRYRFLPTTKQQATLSEWMHTARATYNETIHVTQSEKIYDFNTLRNRLTPRKNIPLSKKWVLSTPKDVRAESIREVVAAYKSAKENLKNGNINHFKIGFRSRKKQTKEHINVPHTAIKILNNDDSIKIYSRYIHSAIKLHHENLFKVNHQVKIVHVKKCNLWYIHVPVDHDIQTIPENQGRTVSIDPGEKTFLTCYYPDGELVKIGHYDVRNKIVPLLDYQDEIKSLLSTSIWHTKTRYNLKRRLAKLRFKIKNMIKEIHHKAAQFLVKSASTIFLPRLASVTRRMHLSKCKRRLLCWSHSAFIDLLDHYCQRYSCQLRIVTEEYTSKTCGCCGFLNDKLKAHNTYKCPKCNIAIDRDGNAARNIFIKTCC